MRNKKQTGSRKGQAALEFLSTYGFAFLIILVMIGALAYFGVLDPTRFMPERCTFSSEIDCQDYQIQGDGTGDVTVSLQVGNNIGNQIDVHALALSSEFCSGTNGVCTLGDCDNAGAGWTITAGGAQTVTCDTSGESFPAAGQKIRVAVDLTWQELGRPFNHTATGEVFATIES